MVRRKRIYKMESPLGTLHYLRGVKDAREWWYTATLINSPAFACYLDVLKKHLTDPKFIEELERTVDPYERSRKVGNKVKEAVKEYLGMTPEEVAKVGEGVLSAIKTMSEKIGETKKAIEELVSLIPA